MLDKNKKLPYEAFTRKSIKPFFARFTFGLFKSKVGAFYSGRFSKNQP